MVRPQVHKVMLFGHQFCDFCPFFEIVLIEKLQPYINNNINRSLSPPPLKKPTSQIAHRKNLLTCLEGFGIVKGLFGHFGRLNLNPSGGEYEGMEALAYPSDIGRDGFDGGLFPPSTGWRG